MLGDGESEYSKLLIQYFDELLERFCAYDEVDDYVEKFRSDIDAIKKIVIFPKYFHLRKALQTLVAESLRIGSLSEAIRFQKEEIFFVILEGTDNDKTGDEVHGDYCLPLESRISTKIQELRSLMTTGREMSDE
jgi:hypothetical protein